MAAVYRGTVPELASWPGYGLNAYDPAAGIARDGGFIFETRMLLSETYVGASEKRFDNGPSSLVVSELLI